MTRFKQISELNFGKIICTDENDGLVFVRTFFYNHENQTNHESNKTIINQSMLNEYICIQ